MYQRILLYLMLLLPFSVLSQTNSITKEETTKIEYIIYHYFEDRLPQTTREISQYMKERPAELFFCLLGIDSSGKVERLNLLSDAKNRDSGFVLFSRMTSLDFKDWQCEKCGGKTLMILITIDNRNDKKPKYVRNLGLSGFFKTNEANDLIILRGIGLGWPTITEESLPVNGVVR